MNRCDGWNGYELNPYATVVSVDSHASWMNEANNTTNQVSSLSACADLQRAWEGPRGSLTVVLCEFLSKPSLLLSFFLFCCTEREERLSEIIDHKKAAFPIIRNSCQVRHSPPASGRLYLSDAFTPFLVSNSMRTAAPRIIIPFRRQRKRRAEKDLVSNFRWRIEQLPSATAEQLGETVSVLLFGCRKPLMTRNAVIRTWTPFGCDAPCPSFPVLHFPSVHHDRNCPSVHAMTTKLSNLFLHV